MNTIFGKVGRLFRVATADIEATERFSFKTKVTLVTTLLFLLSLLLVSAIQLYLVKTQMKTVLAEQQHAFDAQVADALDQNLLAHLGFIDGKPRTISSEIVEDSVSRRPGQGSGGALRAIFSDVFVVSAQDGYWWACRCGAFTDSMCPMRITFEPLSGMPEKIMCQVSGAKYGVSSADT
jgi:hypothetical protein